MIHLGKCVWVKRQLDARRWVLGVVDCTAVQSINVLLTRVGKPAKWLGEEEGGGGMKLAGCLRACEEAITITCSLAGRRVPWTDDVVGAGGQSEERARQREREREGERETGKSSGSRKARKPELDSTQGDRGVGEACIPNVETVIYIERRYTICIEYI